MVTEYYCICGSCESSYFENENEVIVRHIMTRKNDTIGPIIIRTLPDEQTKQFAPLKSTNPKDVAGTDRAPMHLFSIVALVEESLALLEGLLKYGANNWMVEGVKASVYVAAIARHLFKWFFGQERDPATNVHHLASARADLGILIEAAYRKKLVDDRPPSLPRLDELFTHAESVAKGLFKLYGDRKPKHYTIEDTQK